MILKIYTESKQELTDNIERGFLYFDNVSEVFPKTVDAHGAPAEVTLTFYDKDKNYHATSLKKYAYLMTDSGKTIDTIMGTERLSSSTS